jgi:hypothetical protein
MILIIKPKIDTRYLFWSNLLSLQPYYLFYKIPLWQIFFDITFICGLDHSQSVCWTNMTVFPPLLNGLWDAANLLKHVQHLRRYFCAKTLLNRLDR